MTDLEYKVDPELREADPRVWDPEYDSLGVDVV